MFMEKLLGEYKPWQTRGSATLINYITKDYQVVKLKDVEKFLQENQPNANDMSQSDLIVFLRESGYHIVFFK